MKYNSLKWAASKLGLEIRRLDTHEFPVEALPAEIEIMKSVRPFTMTSSQRIWGAMRSVRYLVENDLPGAIVECGVWRGGTIMAMLAELRVLGDESRDIYLFDTFTGMTDPTDWDIDARNGMSAAQLMSATASESKDGDNVWAVSSLEQTRRNVLSIGYPEEKIHFVEGDVRVTLQHRVPQEIALLRLDTDWYESTASELEVLYPSIVSGGVCIIDDYGHYAGARKAVDEYLGDHNLNPLIISLDYTARIWAKA